MMDEEKEIEVPLPNLELQDGALMTTCRFTEPGMELEMVGALMLLWKATANRNMPLGWRW